MPGIGMRSASVAIVVLASLTLAACGSGSPTSSGSQTSPSAAQAQRDGLAFARCMRSHGVTHFPDPSSHGGGIDFHNVPGADTSSPAFRTAQTACENLLPVKRAPSQQPTAQAYARLLHWAKCMRAHGISDLPDPKPDPPPSPGSAVANRYHTLMGDGGYWVGIPTSVNAHSPAFMHLSTVCGESPTGPHH